MKTDSHQESWETPRRCKECLKDKRTVYTRAQAWGSGIWRITCPECGFSETGTWDGHGSSHGQEEA